MKLLDWINANKERVQTWLFYVYFVRLFVVCVGVMVWMAAHE